MENLLRKIYNNKKRKIRCYAGKKIIVIDEGKVSDIGSPQSLSKKKGIYSELLHYQIEGNKKLLEKFEIY